MCEVDLRRRSWVAEVGVGKETDSSVQSSPVQSSTPGHSGTTGGFRRAGGERNLKSAVVQGRCARLGRVHVSGTDGLESKREVDRQVCGTMDPAQGRRHDAKTHKRRDGERCAGHKGDGGPAEQARSRLGAGWRLAGRGSSVKKGPGDAAIWCDGDGPWCRRGCVHHARRGSGGRGGSGRLAGTGQDPPMLAC